MAATMTSGSTSATNARHERRHLAAWTVVLIMAVVNGIIRDFTYGRWLGWALAHSLSVAPLVVGILALSFWLAGRWPLADRAATWRIGAIWLVATLLFEFGLGAAAGHPWSELLAQYDVRRGSLWPLVPLTMALAPWIAQHLRQPRVASAS
jgi:hypothetical protein